MTLLGRIFLGRCGGLRRSWAFVFLTVALAASAYSQTPTPTPDTDISKPIGIRTDLVSLTLTVTDLYGRYVSGLTKSAFTIIDNNQEQEITYFSDADAPVSVGVVFDVSGSMSGQKILKARNALKRFVASSHPS